MKRADSEPDNYGGFRWLRTFKPDTLLLCLNDIGEDIQNTRFCGGPVGSDGICPECGCGWDRQFLHAQLWDTPLVYAREEREGGIDYYAVKCPFCGKKHRHTPAEGGRHSHCQEGDEYIILAHPRPWLDKGIHRVPTTKGKRQMASAFEATVQLYKNDHGVSIVTDATTVESFEQALAKVIAEDWNEYDAGLLVPQVRAILNKLQGYKSEAQERRLLIAGQTMPSPVDLRFTTGPGLPSVELAPSNGEVAGV